MPPHMHKLPYWICLVSAAREHGTAQLYLVALTQQGYGLALTCHPVSILQQKGCFPTAEDSSLEKFRRLGQITGAKLVFAFEEAQSVDSAPDARESPGLGQSPFVEPDRVVRTRSRRSETSCCVLKQEFPL